MNQLMTNKLDTHNNTNYELKLYDNNKRSNNNIDDSHQYVEVKITTCLTDDHKKCTGKYINSFGNLLVNCMCNCHNLLDAISRIESE